MHVLWPIKEIATIHSLGELERRRRLGLLFVVVAGQRVKLVVKKLNE